MFPKTKAEREQYLDQSRRDKYGRERDSRRQKLYDAERETTVLEGAALPSVPEMQSYVDSLVTSAWWKNRFALDHITVKDGRGRRSANGYLSWNGGVVKMPRWSRYELWLLHEVAHTVVQAPHAGHGRLFARVFLELVQHQMGKEAYRAMKKAYQKHNVKFHPYRE